MRPHALEFLGKAALSASLLFIPVFVMDMGGTEVHIGLISAGYNSALFVSSYLSGRAADVYGKRLFLYFGLGTSAAAFLLQVFTVASGQIPLLALNRILCGLAAGMYPGALIAYAYETKTKVGKFSSYGSLGWGLGTFLAGILAIYWKIFLLSSGLFLLAFILSFLLPRYQETRFKVPFFPKDIIKKNLREYFAVLLRHTGAAGIWIIFPLFLRDMGASPFWIGLIYMVNLGTQFFVMQLIDDLKGESMLISGLGLSIVAFLSFTIAPDYWWMIPTQFVLGTAWALMYIGALKIVLLRTREKATASGLLASTLSISGILGPLWAGFVAYEFGYEATMYVAALLTVLGLFVSIVRVRTLYKKDARYL